MFASALVALGLSSTVWYIRAQQNCGTQHLQDELPTLDRSLDAIDEEVPATMLLQSQLHMSSLMQERTAPTSSLSKLLILIVSCHQHADHWSYLTKWGEEVHPGGKVLTMAGRLPNQTLPPLLLTLIYLFRYIGPCPLRYLFLDLSPRFTGWRPTRVERK
jgi:hypothetical protein